MKKLLITVLALFLAVPCFAQCVAEIKDVVQDEVRGSIIVMTTYTLNGKWVQDGQTRYLETSGTNEEIIAKVNEDIQIHCENIVRRIPENAKFLQDEKLKKQKELTQPIIDAIKPLLVGVKATKTEATDSFKGVEINVKADKSTLPVKEVIEKVSYSQAVGVNYDYMSRELTSTEINKVMEEGLTSETIEEPQVDKLAKVKEIGKALIYPFFQ